MSVSWVCYRGYNSPRKLDNVFHASTETSSITDCRKKETTHSEFVILRLQANPTSAERASMGNYWSRSVSVIEAQFYHHHEDKWIEVDGLWAYNVQFLMSDSWLTWSRAIFLSMKIAWTSSESKYVIATDGFDRFDEVLPVVELFSDQVRGHLIKLDVSIEVRLYILFSMTDHEGSDRAVEPKPDS